jgi:hypothetical protein
MIEALREFWCEFTHGGGFIMRDKLGRINWQCAKCGRWGVPISAEDEAAVVNATIRNSAKDKP